MIVNKNNLSLSPFPRRDPGAMRGRDREPASEALGPVGRGEGRDN